MEYGIELNLTECEAYLFGGTEGEQTTAWRVLAEVASGISRVEAANLKLNNVPLTESAVDEVWSAKGTEIAKFVRALDLRELHHLMFLLRCCLSAPKVMYLLRTTPMWRYPDKLTAYDNFMRESTERLCHIKLAGITWTQASLPVAKGGVGIRRTEQVALPTYLASTCFVSTLVQGIRLLGWEEKKADAMATWSSLTSVAVQEGFHKFIQKAWDKLLTDHDFFRLLEHHKSNAHATGRLPAVSQIESGS